MEVGLIKEVDRRATSRKPEAIYESVGKNYQLPKLGSDPEVAVLRRKAVAAGLRHVSRGYEEASRAAETDAEVRPYMNIIRATERLSQEDTKTFFAMIEEAVNFVKSHEAPDGRRLHWSSVAFPDVPRKPR